MTIVSSGSSVSMSSASIVRYTVRAFVVSSTESAHPLALDRVASIFCHAAFRRPWTLSPGSARAMLAQMTDLETWLAADLRETLGGGDGPALASKVGGLKVPALCNLRARARETMVERLRSRGLPAADSDALWIGWAGPLAADTRAELILQDLARLERLLDDPMQAVRLAFAGVVTDGAGQRVRDGLAELAEDPRFEGRLLLLEGGDPAAAQILVQGVDLWLDTALSAPADTSAPGVCEWAAANGALILTTAVTRANASWTIRSAEPFDDRVGRDAFDSRGLYEILEREIVPSFYEWDAQAIPQAWIERVRSSLRKGLSALTQ